MLALCAKNCVASMSKGEKINDKFDFLLLGMSLMPNDKLTQIVNSYEEYVVDTTSKAYKQNQTKQKSPNGIASWHE